MMSIPVELLSKEAKNLCMEIMQGEGVVVRKTKRLIVNGRDYITDQDSQETQAEKWKAFYELEKASVLSVKSVHPTEAQVEYRIERVLAKNVR